jgi:hypothetical protein
MIGQILSNNNEKCYMNFSQNFLASKHALSKAMHTNDMTGSKSAALIASVLQLYISPGNSMAAVHGGG